MPCHSLGTIEAICLGKSGKGDGEKGGGGGEWVQNRMIDYSAIRPRVDTDQEAQENALLLNDTKF